MNNRTANLVLPDMCCLFCTWLLTYCTCNPPCLWSAAPVQTLFTWMVLIRAQVAEDPTAIYLPKDTYNYNEVTRRQFTVLQKHLLPEKCAFPFQCNWISICPQDFFLSFYLLFFTHLLFIFLSSPIIVFLFYRFSHQYFYLSASHCSSVKFSVSFYEQFEKNHRILYRWLLSYTILLRRGMFQNMYRSY